jgi:hypothetical protein
MQQKLSSARPLKDQFFLLYKFLFFLRRCSYALIIFMPMLSRYAFNIYMRMLSTCFIFLIACSATEFAHISHKFQKMLSTRSSHTGIILLRTKHTRNTDTQWNLGAADVAALNKL